MLIHDSGLKGGQRRMTTQSMSSMSMSVFFIMSIASSSLIMFQKKGEAL